MPSVPQTSPTLSYRADIDGLRGIAVLLVIGYHLQTRVLRGGFIGVDVFFVISGFLISSVILAQISASKFSLRSFYERRIRRIFPALIVMLFITSLLAYRYFLPNELLDFAKSLVTATFSVSNIYFWKHSGYFDAPSAMKPLLHTWSLGVEEQFYIFFPLFLIFVCKRFPKKVLLTVAGVAAVSFAASAVGAFRDPVPTFYLAQTRAWELLLGSILALDALPALSRPVQRNIAAATGVILIFAAGYYFTDAMPFPGIAALAPCLGAALIIAAGQSGPSVVGRALSFRPLVFIGLISYSLYLWHWPIIVFHGFATLQPSVSGHLEKATILLVSLAVATASWKFVEVPFRNGRLKLTGTAVFKAALAGASIVAVIGFGMIVFHGVPSRLPGGAIRVASYEDEGWVAQYRTGTCFLSSDNRFEDFNSSTCLHADKAKKNYLLIGDSHAAQLWYGLSQTFPDVNIMQATASGGCLPTLEQPPGSAERCQRLMRFIFQFYLPAHHVDTVLIAARWSPGDVARLSPTILWLQQRGIDVTLFGPIVQYDSELPRLLAVSIWKGAPAIPYQHRLAVYQQLDGTMRIMAASRWHVRYVSYFSDLCGPASCVEWAGDGIPLQSDYGHLTPAGSVLVAQTLRKDRQFP